MLITQTKAIQQIKAATGLSIASATEIVRAMPTKADGKREKVSTYSVENAIAKANAPLIDPAEPSTVRPVSARKARRIIENCI